MRQYRVNQNRLTDKQAKQLERLANDTERLCIPNDDEAAFIVLMRICRDYLNSAEFPFIKGDDRDEWLIEKLKRYRIKFFEKV